MIDQICIVVASNDEDCLRRNLLASEMIIRHNVPLQIERNAPSAAVAYNRALDATTAPIVIFAHQDVYFPPGWEQHLAAVLRQLDGLIPGGPCWHRLECRTRPSLWGMSGPRV